MTPLLWPVWWAAGADSFSTTTTRRDGSRRRSSCAVARPRMPAPMMATSHVSAPRGVSAALSSVATLVVVGARAPSVVGDGIRLAALARHAARGELVHRVVELVAQVLAHVARELLRP